MRETMKDANGNAVGYKKICGPLELAEDPSGKMIGRYDKNTNTTFDKHGKALYRDNQTSALFGR